MEYVFLETVLANVMYFPTEQLLHIGLKGNAEYSLKNVENTFLKIHELKRDNQIYVAIDLSKISFEHIPKETLAYLANNPYVKYQLKLAVIVKNLAHKIFGSSYLKIFNPKTETRVFKNLPDAIEWFGLRDQDKKIKAIEQALQNNN